MNRHIQFTFTILSGIFTVFQLQAQTDTVRLSAQEAETIFLQNNLGLLAEKLNIDIAEAHILQAKAWPNPNLAVEEIQLYTTPTTDKSPPLIGNFWRNRTFSAQLEQLIYTAGKRRKNINLQVQNQALAQSTFNDVLASLKISFRQQVAELIYQQQVLNTYEIQSSMVNNLVKARQAQYREGNISQAEWYRIKALQMNLQSEINQIKESITGLQQNLKTLMVVDAKNYLYFNESFDLNNSIRQLEQQNLDALIAASQSNNTGLRIYESELKVADANLRLEKANRVPDLNLNANYDRNGNNQLNFAGVGVSMDLPFFNRNKGNIKAAQFDLDKTILLKQNKEKEITNSVVKYWSDLNNALQLYHNADTLFIQQADGMLDALSRNFQARNINLLEFLDYFESFRESKNKYFENIRNIIIKKEELGYLTGRDF